MTTRFALPPETGHAPGRPPDGALLAIFNALVNPRRNLHHFGVVVPRFPRAGQDPHRAPR